MKVAGMRELQTKSMLVLDGDEPVLVTRHGKVSGVYVPLDAPDRLPDDLRRELAKVLGKHLAKLLERKGVTEKNIAEDFHAYRERRR